MADSHPFWQRSLARLGAFFLGLVLLVAAWAKALDPSAFAGEVERQGLAILLPALAVAIFALALEVGLGTLLVLGVRRAWVLWPSALLVVFFLFLTGRTYWRSLQGIVDEEASCGCFGNLVERTPAEAFWQDMLLMVPALLLAFLARPRGEGWPRWRVAVASVLALGVCVLAWKAPDLPLDNLATRLRPGVQALELCAGTDDAGNPLCMDAVLPEMATGEHLVIMAELEGPLSERAQELNEYHWAAQGPSLWVLTTADEEALFAFRFQAGPAFNLREAPPSLLRPLYRTLPRSFLTRDGEVVETFAGLPPLERWSRPAS